MKAQLYHLVHILLYQETSELVHCHNGAARAFTADIFLLMVNSVSTWSYWNELTVNDSLAIKEHLQHHPHPCFDLSLRNVCFISNYRCDFVL